MKYDPDVWKGWSEETFKCKGVIFTPIQKTDKTNINRLLRKFAKNKSDEQTFYHFCFCIMAPQTTYESNRQTVQELIDNDFYRVDITQEQLEQIVKRTRFYRNKAGYLLSMKQGFQELLKDLRAEKNTIKKRSLIVKRVKGMGLKASSHFLRNTGVTSLAIIDSHVMGYLGYVQKSPKNNTEYLEIEQEFKQIAKYNKVTSAFLDALVWKKSARVNIEEYEKEASVKMRDNSIMMIF